jgi:hypothetical protein
MAMPFAVATSAVGRQPASSPPGGYRVDSLGWSPSPRARWNGVHSVWDSARSRGWLLVSGTIVEGSVLDLPTTGPEEVGELRFFPTGDPSEPPTRTVQWMRIGGCRSVPVEGVPLALASNRLHVWSILAFILHQAHDGNLPLEERGLGVERRAQLERYPV